MFSKSLQWRLCAIVISIIVSVDLVLGQDQAGRYDTLMGPNDESSCDLRDALFAQCNTPSSPLNTTPTATLCTCNNVFFNVWSACSYSTGNNTLPIYSSWLATCANGSIDISQSSAMVTTGYPPWALLAVPGNTSFDLQRAVQVALSSSHRWTALQIILPIISGLFAAVFSVVVMTLCQRRPKNVRWRQEVERMIRYTPRVRNVDRPAEDWGIDPAELPSSGIQDTANKYEPMRPPSPADTEPGHPSQKSVSFNRGSLGQDTMSEEPYPFSPQVQRAFQARPMEPVRTRQDLDSTSSSETSPGKWPISSSSRATLGRMFRKMPFRVTSNPPYRGWGIDQSTDAASSKRTTVATTSEDGPHTRSSVNPIGVADDYNDFADSQDDHTHLITDEERTNSLLFTEEELGTGQRTTSTSVNSRIDVVSPSNSTTSPTSANPSRMSGISFRAQIPSLPPPPTKPAPTPPPQPPSRMGQRGRGSSNTQGPSLNHFLPERTMTPIQEDLSDVTVDSRSRAPLGNLEYTPASQASGRQYSSERRPLPFPSSSPGQPMHQHTHSLSSGSEASKNDNSSLRSTHSRSSSADHPRPLPPTHGQVPSNQQQVPFDHGHQRSDSNNSASSGHLPSPDYFDDVFLPSVPHGRGLSAEDTDSFYWTSEPAVSSGRSGTPNSLSDPSAFFPAPVRGAGYGGFR